MAAAAGGSGIGFAWMEDIHDTLGLSDDAADGGACAGELPHGTAGLSEEEEDGESVEEGELVEAKPKKVAAAKAPEEMAAAEEEGKVAEEASAARAKKKEEEKAARQKEKAAEEEARAAREQKAARQKEKAAVKQKEKEKAAEEEARAAQEQKKAEEEARAAQEQKKAEEEEARTARAAKKKKEAATEKEKGSAETTVTCSDAVKQGVADAKRAREAAKEAVVHAENNVKKMQDDVDTALSAQQAASTAEEKRAAGMEHGRTTWFLNRAREELVKAKKAALDAQLAKRAAHARVEEEAIRKRPRSEEAEATPRKRVGEYANMMADVERGMYYMPIRFYVSGKHRVHYFIIVGGDFEFNNGVVVIAPEDKVSPMRMRVHEDACVRACTRCSRDPLVSQNVLVAKGGSFSDFVRCASEVYGPDCINVRDKETGAFVSMSAYTYTADRVANKVIVRPK